MDNLRELSNSELENIQGGFWREAVGFAVWVYDNWDDISAGYNEGFNDYA